MPILESNNRNISTRRFGPAAVAPSETIDQMVNSLAAEFQQELFAVEIASTML